VLSVISKDVKTECWNIMDSWTWRRYVRVTHPTLYNSIFLLKSFMQSSYVVAHSWEDRNFHGFVHYRNSHASYLVWIKFCPDDTVRKANMFSKYSGKHVSLFVRCPMHHFIMLTPHEQIVETELHIGRSVNWRACSLLVLELFVDH